MFGRKKLDARMDEEFAFHMEEIARGLMAQGMSEKDARREAQRQFGNALNIRETYRDQRGIPWLEDFVADLKYAVRLLARNPVFSLVAILTLALGTGANTAVFSLVSAVYLRPAPYPNHDRLVDIQSERQGRRFASAFDSRSYLYWKERVRLFEELAASKGGGDLSLIANGEAEQVKVNLVTANYFRTLGVAPVVGRDFTAADDRRGSDDVVVISWGLWQRRFGGDPALLGRSIQLGGKLATVIGITGRDFTAVNDEDLWAPLRAIQTNDGRNTIVFGLLRPGVSHVAASKEVSDLIAQYERDYPQAAGDFARDERAAVATFASYTRESGVVLLVLFGAVVLTLLIACANLGSLLLARATARVREVAIRATLGAGRGRIIRQLLAESLVIAACGTLAGLGLAYALIPGLLAISPFELPAWQPVTLDWRVLLFTAATAIGTGILFGALPAWQASRLDLSEAVKTAGGSKTSSSKASGRLRQMIVAAEVALSLMLLVGAGLFLRTFASLLSVRTGVDTTNTIAAKVPLQGERYATAAATEALFRKGAERLRALPNVESVALVSNLPMERGLNLVAWIPGSANPEEAKLMDWRFITPGALETLRVPLVAGRMLDERDGAGSTDVAVINQEFVRHYFPGQNALGRSLIIMRESPIPDRPRVIVGVVGDVKSANFRRPAEPTAFVPLAQAPDKHIEINNSFFQASWIVRTHDAPGAFAATLQRELKAADPLQPIGSIRTLEEVRSRALRQDRSMMVLIGGFALLALLLASAGIYGVMAYSVAQRRQEIGIRMALGATPGNVVGEVVRHASLLALVGVVVGCFGAVALTRFVSGMVWGVKATDPATFAAAAGILFAVAALASLAPAMRAVRVDPLTALRIE